MTIYEIRDPDDARRHLLSSLWLARSSPLDAERIGDALRWAAEVVSEGAPLPPLGFVADVGRVIQGLVRTSEPRTLTVPKEVEPGVWSRYEDYVLGKFYADMTFERGADAVQRYEGRDRDRAVAYVLNAIRKRANFGGALLSSAVVNALRAMKPAEVMGESLQLIEQEGWSDELIEEFEDLTNAVRMTGDLLGPEDIFELESGTALAEFGQRVALRQVLQAAAMMEQGLPRQKPRATPRQYSVATNIMDEDSYPIGGFTSISNRGTIESLLRSELAYMDSTEETRPDLFDIKFVRDELLYYARDENQFLRRRLSFFFLIHPDLVKARFKDPACSWQRIIYVLALLTLAVKKLLEWLSNDSIHFELLFIQPTTQESLEDEILLLHTLLGEELQKDLVLIETVAEGDLGARLATHARQSLCHVTTIGSCAAPPSDLPIPSALQVREAVPEVWFGDRGVDCGESGDSAWQTCAEEFLRWWI